MPLFAVVYQSEGKACIHYTTGVTPEEAIMQTPLSDEDEVLHVIPSQPTRVVVDISGGLFNTVVANRQGVEVIAIDSSKDEVVYELENIHGGGESRLIPVYPQENKAMGSWGGDACVRRDSDTQVSPEEVDWYHDFSVEQSQEYSKGLL